MAKYDYDIVVLGGGAAGLTVASGAAQLGARTLLIEKEKELGGDCLHFGCVPSKTLIKTAHVYHLMRNAEKFGLPKVSLVPVNFSDIADRIRRVVGIIQEHDSVKRFNSLGAEIGFGNPCLLDEHVIAYDGRKVSARKIVIATGSRAAVPDIEGLAAAGYLTNREIFYLDTLPKSLIILGAGPIAMEMAQAFGRLGTCVTVLQRSGQVLSKEDTDMADVVMTTLRQEGVTIYLHCRIKRVETAAGLKRVVIQHEGTEKSIEGTDILVALGRQVNVEGLGLDAAGVRYDTKGIAVDTRMRTNQRHIFAAGDVTGGYQFTHAAGYEGGIIVSNAIFNLPRRADYTWMPRCTYTGPELAGLGLNEKAAKTAGIDYTIVREEFAASDRALAEEEPGGCIKLLLDSREKPIGVQIVGLHGGEVIGEWVAAMNGGVKLSTLAGAVHPYPTLAEMNKRIAGAVFSKKIFSEKVRNILSFLFRYQGSSV